MNPKILHKKVQYFIDDNLKTEITKIILKGSPFDEISVEELANQIQAKKKAKNKLPTWFLSENIYYPEKISIEQTSSEITAKYKASLVSGDKLIDITGGFGVDAYYFSKQFKQVFHCEINSDLSEIVRHNYKQLNIKNIEFFPENGLEILKDKSQQFDCIYIDPSRRNDTKGKVFLLKDCVPNISPKIDFLFTKTNQILIKNSPILDITSTINELKFVKEIHVVAVENEVKEVLFLLEKEYQKGIYIKTINFAKKGNQSFSFSYKNNELATYSKPLNYLYEPNSAILKSGGFQEVSSVLKVDKLHQHSHLYTSENQIDFPGRVFKIEQILNYDKKKIKRILPEKKANITTRNFPKPVVQIRKELNCKDGGELYLFFTTNFKNKKIVLVCKKVV